MDLKYYLPLLLVIISNVFYHNIAKNSPGDANVYLSLAVSYTISMICTFLMFFLNGGKLTKAFGSLNWTSYALGIAIMGIEFGFITMYRNGWEISSSALFANIIVAVILLFIGMILYRERITMRQLLGVGLCMLGLFLIKVH